ncbi:hypothetical protein PB1_03400 [Bacillus methanolicus PB1]|uniref:Uncharacterized protein n=1 Tax=Bacillus methanolicus PB1 TaxID=997296 RepID=I3E632_BACMT|nr:hypothetical protein PB1_03400 [Bacillus methanolicus PB1]
MIKQENFALLMIPDFVLDENHYLNKNVILQRW